MARGNLAEALRVYREALAFYRNQWQDPYGTGEAEPTDELLEDAGQKAKIALEHGESLGG